MNVLTQTLLAGPQSSPGTRERVLNTYSSLPRPGRMVGWRYADTEEVSSRQTILARRTEVGGPEYANLIPWSQRPAPATQPVVHYATLGRAPHTKRLITASQGQTFIIL